MPASTLAGFALDRPRHRARLGGPALILFAPDETTRAMIDVYARSRVGLISGPVNAEAVGRLAAESAAAREVSSSCNCRAARNSARCGTRAPYPTSPRNCPGRGGRSARGGQLFPAAWAPLRLLERRPDGAARSASGLRMSAATADPHHRRRSGQPPGAPPLGRMQAPSLRFRANRDRVNRTRRFAFPRKIPRHGVLHQLPPTVGGRIPVERRADGPARGGGVVVIEHAAGAHAARGIEMLHRVRESPRMRTMGMVPYAGCTSG